LCRPSVLGESQVTSGAPDGPTCAVRRFASGSDGFPDYPIAPGNTYEPCDGLSVTPDYPM
jgi:hypothetical protein